MTGRPGHTTTARWQLKKMLDRPWTEIAACVQWTHLPWVSDHQPAKEEYLQMASICADCPVLDSCAQYALYGNGGHGTEGGFYAGVFIPWQTYYRSDRQTISRQMARGILRKRYKGKKMEKR